MAFDSITLLTMSMLLMAVMGGLMIHASRDCPALRLWGVAFLLPAIGFALLLGAPNDGAALLRVVSAGVGIATYPLLLVGAWRFDRRRHPAALAFAGLVLWAVAMLFGPSAVLRAEIGSAIIAGYSLVVAVAIRRRDADALESRRWAASALFFNAGFYGLRALLGPTFGLAAWNQRTSADWGALLGAEAVLVGVVLGSLLISLSRERTASLHEREALEDTLTGIGNRRALFRSGTALLDQARNADRPAALLLMDLDGFKAVNDRHGHEGGDRLLVAFARMAHDYLPPTSLVCRIGGEEFAAVLPGADRVRARAVADEIRALFAHLSIPGQQGPIRTTVSIGIVPYDGMEQPEMAVLLDRADRCLYAAKSSGRNQVVVEHGAPRAPRHAAPIVMADQRLSVA